MLNSGWVLWSCFPLSHLGRGVEEVGWEWMSVMEGVCMEKGYEVHYIYYLLLSSMRKTFISKKENSGNSLRWDSSNLGLWVWMWVSQSPEIIFMWNESFPTCRMATALFAWGNIGLLIHIWTLELLLIAMLCDGWEGYLVYSRTRSPTPHSVFDCAEYLSDTLNRWLVSYGKINQCSSWFYTHYGGINYKSSLTWSKSVFTLSLFPFMCLRK